MRVEFSKKDVLRILAHYIEGVTVKQIHAELSAALPGTFQYYTENTAIINHLSQLKKQGYAVHVDKGTWAPVVA